MKLIWGEDTMGLAMIPMSVSREGSPNYGRWGTARAQMYSDASPDFGEAEAVYGRSRAAVSRLFAPKHESVTSLARR